MRLLNAEKYEPGSRKLEMIERWGSQIPPYAIFSHTWSDSELLFVDIMNGTFADQRGFYKLERAIVQAKEDGWSWLWADNCCIDKTNSVELSEAINFMFKWWERVWTLQELIAPPSLRFYSKEWKCLDTRNTLREIIKKSIGIEDEYLMGYPIEHASIAKRMSWAAKREITRDEDKAYCLIGIFDVNMPMLYGEGTQRAVARLQEEIMRNSEDQSLFAWIKPRDDGAQHGLLADSPADFINTGLTTAYWGNADLSPATMTTRGLHISLPLTEIEDGTFVAALLCPGIGYQSRIAVYLKKLPTGRNQYTRVKCHEIVSTINIGQPQEIYVRQGPPAIESRLDRPHWFQLDKLSCMDGTLQPMEYEVIEQRSLPHPEIIRPLSHSKPDPPPKDWCNLPLVYRIEKSPRCLAVALLIRRKHDREGFTLMLGAHSDFSVGFCVSEIEVSSSLKTFHSLQSRFAPRLPGSVMFLKFHDVHVTVNERLEDTMSTDDKMYFVDIKIWARSRFNALPSDIQDAIKAIEKKRADAIAKKAAETARNKRGLKASVSDKIKRIRA